MSAMLLSPSKGGMQAEARGGQKTGSKDPELALYI